MRLFKIKLCKSIVHLVNVLYSLNMKKMTTKRNFHLYNKHKIVKKNWPLKNRRLPRFWNYFSYYASHLFPFFFSSSIYFCVDFFNFRLFCCCYCCFSISRHYFYAWCVTKNKNTCTYQLWSKVTLKPKNIYNCVLFLKKIV